MTEVTQLTPGIWQISLPFQGETDIIGSYLLAGSDEIALIDPGPESTSEALLEGIRQAGFDPARVTHILATHIHLDHTGGVGKLLASMPQARVFVHSKGAQHLIDPGKLISSSERIYGERMQELWGEILPVPQEKVQVIAGGDVLNVAGRRLEVHYTPGHAIHHVIFFDVHSGDLFAGDVAGVRLPGITYGRPPTPPPDLDIEAWSSSIDTLKKLRPDVIYLAHFGAVRNLAPHLESIRAKLFNWGDLVLRAMRENKSEAEIIELFVAETRPELQRISNDPHTLERYEIASNYPMTVQGYMRYWKLKSQNR